MNTRIFRLKYALIPVALPAMHGEGNVLFRELLIFGFRIAYWTVLR